MEQMLALGPGQAQSPPQCFDHLLRRIGRPPLFQARDIVHRDAGQQGQLLTAQPRRTPMTTDRQPSQLRRHLVSPPPHWHSQPQEDWTTGSRCSSVAPWTAAGHIVYTGSRSAERGAGIEERGDNNTVIGAADITADVMRTTFETNVFGTVRVTHAFLPLLQASAAPVVVIVSSGLASLTGVSTPDTPAYGYPGIAYPASKTALNMVTVQFAKAFPALRINAVEPGFTKTDLNGNTGIQTAEEGAQIIVRMAQVALDGPTGGFFDANGALPW